MRLQALDDITLASLGIKSQPLGKGLEDLYMQAAVANKVGRDTGDQGIMKLAILLLAILILHFLGRLKGAHRSSSIRYGRKGVPLFGDSLPPHLDFVS
jgi:hypothetical protein